MGYQSALATAFEEQVRKLGLNLQTCANSKELRLWCERNKDHCYIPEWLLARWNLCVNPDDGRIERRTLAALRPITH